MTNSSLQNLNKKSVKDQVFDQLMNQIVEGVWKPGDKIPSENELASIFGVSRISVREAIQKLKAMELIETHRGKGSFVKAFTTSSYLQTLTPMLLLSKADILYVIEYRRILEIGIIDLFMKRQAPDDIQVLKDLLVKMEKYKKDLLKYTTYDLEFHFKLYEMTKNPIIMKISNMISDILSSAMKGAVTEHGAEEGIEFHSRIVAAIEDNNSAVLKKITNELFDKIEVEIKEEMEKEKHASF